MEDSNLIPINDLPFTKNLRLRILHTLRDMHFIEPNINIKISTLGDILKYKISDFEKHRLFGEKSKKELNRVLAMYSKSLED